MDFALARRWVAATRPGFLVVTLLGVLLGSSVGMACGSPGDWIGGAAALLLALLSHAAINLHNDWGDAQIGSDAINTGRIGPFSGGSRVVQDGIFSVEQLRDAVQMLGVIVIGGGILLTARVGPGLLPIGLAGLVLGYAYSHPKLALMSRGVGDVAVALSWWLVVLGADYVQRRQFDVMPAIAGVSLALMVAAILWVAEFPDAAADAQAGKRTLVVRIGLQPAAWVYLLAVVAAHAWVAWWWAIEWLPTSAWWALGSAPLSAAAAASLLRHARQPQRLRPALVLTLAATVLHGVLLIAAYVAVLRLR